MLSSNATKMQWNLLLLILMGHVFMVTCQLYEYHYIGDSKTWDDAQEYCRQSYTDLATVLSRTDQEKLNNKLNQNQAWVGLRREIFGPRETWWNHDEPNFSGPCVWIREDYKLGDNRCEISHPFICYNETGINDENFQTVTVQKERPEAQEYCRQHHTDLISGLDQLSKLKDQNRTEFSDCDEPHCFFWTGQSIYSWSWSDGSRFNFTIWEEDYFKTTPQLREDTGKCAVMLKDSENGNFENCAMEKPFFCHTDKVVLVKENMTWEEALYYCREEYDDLVSIKNDDDQKLVQERAKNASTPHVWLGLRYTRTLDFWFWISNEAVNYTNWAEGQEANGCDMSGAMATSGDHKWYKQPDEQRFNFLCSKC